jgi:replicative DNA helicase
MAVAWQANMSDRVVPHNLDAERALLGAVLLSPTAWPRVSSVLRQGDFFRVGHQLIFAAMDYMASHGVVVDFVTLLDELKRRGDLDAVGGPAYLSALTDALPSAANVEAYAAIVREKARLRAIIDEATWASDQAYSDDRTSGELSDEVVRRLARAIGTTDAGAVDATTAVKSYARAMQDGTMGDPILSGFIDVDNLVGGFRPADLVYVAARPSVGKTSWALDLARTVAHENRGAAVFFSLEMMASGLAERLLSWESGVPMSSAIRGTATTEQYAVVNRAVDGYDCPLLRIYQHVSSLMEIEAWCRREQQERGVAVVVVDYLQLLSSGTQAQSSEQAVSMVSAGLKRLGKALNVPIVALSQLSRAPEGRADKRPQLSDLRGSGCLEQDADIALLLHRQDMHARTPENDGVAEVIVAKHRNGPTGVVRLYFDKNLARFQALAHGGAYG